MQDGKISIAGLSKAKVLAALYNNSQQLGMGFMHARGATGMTEAQAQQEIDALAERGYKLRFDYLHGRVMKVDLSTDDFWPGLYDRDNGQGAAARVIESVRTESQAA